MQGRDRAAGGRLLGVERGDEPDAKRPGYSLPDAEQRAGVVQLGRPERADENG